MASSGVNAYDVESEETCQICEKENLVTVVYDKEDWSRTWTCPNCDWFHLDPYDAYMDNDD